MACPGSVAGGVGLRPAAAGGGVAAVTGGGAVVTGVACFGWAALTAAGGFTVAWATGVPATTEVRDTNELCPEAA
ncbi:MAG TPA: hypothetical protein VF124_07750 [Gaiellaceae bacterium]